MERPCRILVVDDEEPNRELLAELLSMFGHEVELAEDGVAALAKLHSGLDLMLLDVMMPGLNGFQVARKVRATPAVGDLPIIMVTGLAGREDRLAAVEAGANDFVAKPIDATELRVRMTSLLKMKMAQDAIKQHRAVLEETVLQRTAQLRQALADTEKAHHETYAAYLDSIQRLVMAAEVRDYDTAAHIRRVSSYSAVLGRALDLKEHEVEVLRLANPMHDVGKVGISDLILLKPGKLTPGEFAAMQQHTVIGFNLLSGSPSELLQAGALIAISHHEKWDGSGYPHNLAGDAIPLYGRVCAVADVYDALTTDRPYKKAFSDEEALRILKEGRGKHFDPQILDAFVARFDLVLEVRRGRQVV
jgi:putative two-component system response regulator